MANLRTVRLLRDTPRAFTPADKSLIRKVHGYMPAQQLLELLNERLAADLGPRITRAKWDRRRLYITAPMLERLRVAKRGPVKVERFGSNWLFQSAAAVEAGVSNATLIRWADRGEIKRRDSPLGWRYHRKSVRARAKRYWREEVRFRRAIAPDWLRPSPYDLSQGGGLPALAARASA